METELESMDCKLDNFIIISLTQVSFQVKKKSKNLQKIWIGQTTPTSHPIFFKDVQKTTQKNPSWGLTDPPTHF